MNKISGIYGIRSISHPERVYLGSSINLKERIREHKKKLETNRHENSRLQNHYNKYGKNDLVFEIIIKCDTDSTIKTEQTFIDLYKPWFNILHTAGSPSGYRHSNETKIKMGNIQRGRRHTEETRRKISNANKGENNFNWGKHPSAKTKEKQLIHLLNNKYAGHLVINLETGIFYDSICEASRSTNIKACTLWSYLSGRLKNKTMFALV